MSHEIDDEYEEELDWAESENMMEESTTLDLVNKSVVEPNLFNTMNWINNVHERIKDPTAMLLSTKLAISSEVISHYRGKGFDTDSNTLGLEQIEQLNHQFSKLEHQFSKMGSRVDHSLPYKEHFRLNNPLELFLFEMSCGSYPPPEILMMLVKCFNLYFLAEGTLSLEDVFFGKVVKRAGNFSMRKARSDNFKEFHYQVIREKQSREYSSKNFNLEEFALSFLRMSKENETDRPVINVTEDNIESFIVAYYRWKKRNLNKQKSAIDIEEIKSEVVSVLVALGYTQQKAKQTVLEIFDSKLSLEENVRNALGSLF
jgi:hypothetical protein